MSPKEKDTQYGIETLKRGIQSLKEILSIDANLAYYLERVQFELHQRGIREFDDLYSREYYAEMLSDEKMADAREFCAALQTQFSPDSVIELGCGAGRFLIPLSEAGIEILGVDRSQKAFEESPLPADRLEVHDLREPYRTDREFDLVLCIEVLEHIPPEDAETVVRSIATAAPVAVITAAQPGQGGTHHVNEQPPDYWKQKFEAVNMRFRPDLVEAITDSIDPEALEWLEANLLVFERVDEATGVDE